MDCAHYECSQMESIHVAETTELHAKDRRDPPYKPPILPPEENEGYGQFLPVSDPLHWSWHQIRVSTGRIRREQTRTKHHWEKVETQCDWVDSDSKHCFQIPDKTENFLLSSTSSFRGLIDHLVQFDGSTEYNYSSIRFIYSRSTEIVRGSSTVVGHEKAKWLEKT